MKKETYAAKLFELLGMEKEAEKVRETVSKKKTGKVEKYVGVTEDEIQKFRSIQGLHYFLQAPELFSAKVCPHCGETFLVSRQFVAFCSYTCIAKDFEDRNGVRWSRQDDDIEILVKDVYEGNEPLWVNPAMVKRLQEALAMPTESLLSQASSSSQEPPTMLTTSEDVSTSSVLQTTT